MCQIDHRNEPENPRAEDAVDLSRVLRNSGLKNTRNRSAILGILALSDSPVSAEDVYLKLKDKNINVNMSTVYRALDMFAAKNLARKLAIADENRALFEFNRLEHRHYLVCLRCKKTTAIHSCPLANYEKTIAEKTNYVISGHNLNMYGYCPDCRDKSSV
ncbi:MAG: transcriptional repressor [Clostridiales bacterium]|jgi:Fur family ferric uptake transcriptional regulator|nr:transcriptional repressor [Clostridiales bacterium]